MSTLGREMADVEQEVDLTTVLRIAWSYRYLIVAVGIVGAIVAAVMAWNTKPYFRADVLVTEVREGLGSDVSNSPLGGLARLVGGGRTSSNISGQDPQAVLQSRRLVEEFIKRENLLPTLFAGSAKPPSLWLATQRFKDQVLTIREDNRRARTTIAVEWTDPQTAAQWANSLVALANELIRTRALDDANRNIAYLNDQISKTSVVELRRVMYALIETEMKTLMLANAKQEYAFAIVDPAVPPEVRARPQRKVMVSLGLLIGFTVGMACGFAHHLWVRSRHLS